MTSYTHGGGLARAHKCRVHVLITSCSENVDLSRSSESSLIRIDFLDLAHGSGF